MNRQQRRSSQRSGPADDAALVAAEPATGIPDRSARPEPLGGGRQRTTPRQFLHEVDVELRKVAWPSRAETVNYASVVLVTLILVMALIFGLDTGFSEVALYLFK